MITEDYVSFELAKLLNTKGFKGEFHKHYWGYEQGKEFLTDSSFNPEYDYPAPTLQMVMKWLREEMGIYIEIRRNLNIFYFKWYIQEGATDKAFSEYKYKSYEEAVEEAIKYCLENLI